MIMGDNPAVSAGVPVCLAWKAFESATCTIDVYECTKPKTRSWPQMLLPASLRGDILHSAGYSRHELLTASLQAGKIRENRLKSANELSARVQHWIQSVKSRADSKARVKASSLQQDNKVALHF